MECCVGHGCSVCRPSTGGPNTSSTSTFTLWPRLGNDVHSREVFITDRSLTDHTHNVRTTPPHIRLYQRLEGCFVPSRLQLYGTGSVRFRVPASALLAVAPSVLPSDHDLHGETVCADIKHVIFEVRRIFYCVYLSRSLHLDRHITTSRSRSLGESLRDSACERRRAPRLWTPTCALAQPSPNHNHSLKLATRPNSL